jgi:hypothetical protein
MDVEASEEVPEWEWPTGPGAELVLRKQHELAELVASRVPVFLDTNFWVMARQAATGETDEPELISLLGALLLGVQSGKLFFPITSDLIAEFSKQLPERLADTMMMVDRLSLGVALVPHHERIAIEMERFAAQCWPHDPPVPRPIWTCYAFALGYEDLRPDGVEVNDALLVKLAATAWMMPPSLLAQALSPKILEAKAEGDRVAAYLNDQETLHAHEIDGRASAIHLEIAGAASLIEGVAAREFRRIAAAEGRNSEAVDVSGSRQTGRRIAQLIAAGLGQDRNRRLFGSLYVPAMLHAAVRSAAGRKVKPNDVFDFRHTAAALPYCRAFFTDGPLKSLIVSGHMRLDTLYECRVAATPADAIDVIKDLVFGTGNLHATGD